jgi:hypothetical protein
MPRRSKAILAQARSVVRSKRHVLMIFGDPEVGRLQWLGQIPAGAMTSERECVIGLTHYMADPDESTKVFHNRMCQTARDRGEYIVMVGTDEPVREAPPYPARATGAETPH